MGIILTACSSEHDKAGRPRSGGKPLTVAVTQTLDCFPLYVAQEIGIDREVGIALQLQEHGSRADCDTAIIGGSAVGIMTDYRRAEALKQKYGAKDSLYIYPHHNSPLFILASSKGRLREAKQLTDKVIGVDRQGVDALVAQHMLDSVKLGDDKTFLVQMQNYNLRQRMLFANTLDAAVLFEPYASYALKAGHRLLYTVHSHAGKPVGCLLTRGNADVLRKIYNRACDSINANGIHQYDSIMAKRYTIPAPAVSSVSKYNFSHL